jgi:ABC-type nitrate/sulfonate/bicarbonate transport system substrate-binding protein
VMNGKPIAIVATIQTSNRDAAIVARRDRGISQPADLKGKSIGVSLGTSSDFFTDVFLIDHGIDRRSVRIINMTPDEMIKAINTGKIDAAVSWNPALMQLQEMLGDKGHTFYGEMLYTETFCAVAMQKFVKDHPEAIQKFLRALVKAEAFVEEHPADARRLVAEFTKVDKAILDKVWNVYNFRVTLDQALIVDLEDQTRWAMKYRLTEHRKMPNYLGYIYVGGLQSISPARASLIR